jgi:hypothetical protein
MSTSPQFFVPHAEPGTHEEAYAELARFAGRRALPLGQRIYAITYVHDGEEWTAQVGERLRGHTIADPRARAKYRRIERPVSDAAMVLAIFPGTPYIVVTDGGVVGVTRSAWENPFLAGQPRSVALFGSAP